MNRVLLFNPRSARYKPRIPNSILSIASAIEGRFQYVIVDGNMETDPWPKIREYLLYVGMIMEISGMVLLLNIVNYYYSTTISRRFR